MQEDVILVDKNDKRVGTREKLEAHKEGLLHRAFSVIIYDDSGRILLQRRAAGKYHSANLWTNTCCSHPRPTETTAGAAARRLKEEMGITADLREVGSLLYRHAFNNGLTEHEYDHVFVGTFSGEPQPDPREVSEYKWTEPGSLKRDIKRSPESYTYWFKKLLANPKI